MTLKEMTIQERRTYAWHAYREALREVGLCLGCQSKEPEPGYKTCPACIEARKLANERRVAKKLQTISEFWNGKPNERV